MNDQWRVTAVSVTTGEKLELVVSAPDAASAFGVADACAQEHETPLEPDSDPPGMIPGQYYEDTDILPGGHDAGPES